MMTRNGSNTHSRDKPRIEYPLIQSKSIFFKPVRVNKQDFLQIFQGSGIEKMKNK